MTPSRRVSIVIPARNEAAGLRQLLPGLVGLELDAEILVVDDGSADDTAAVCTEFGVTRLRNHYALGNGAAIKAGARAAKGDVLIFMDADGQHQPEDIPLLLEKFSTGYDMVVGARQSGSHAGAHRAVANDLFSRFASWMVMQTGGGSDLRLPRGARGQVSQISLPAAQRFFLSDDHHHELFPRRLQRWLCADTYATAHRQQPYSPAAGWRALPADHHQGRHAVFPAKAVSADQRQFLSYRPGVLPLHLLDWQSFYQHECPAFHLGYPDFSDRHRFRADFSAALQGYRP